MNKLKDLFEKMKEYDSARKSVLDDYNYAVNHIKKEFVAGGTTYAERQNEADQRMTSAIKALTDSLMKQVDSTFADVNTALKEYVLRPISADEENIVQNVKAMGENITNLEFSVMYEAVKHSYSAKKYMNGLHQKITGKSAYITLYDDVVEHLNVVESEVRNWVKFYNPDSYGHGILITNYDGNTILNCEKMINDFLDGNDIPVTDVIE